MDFWIAFAGAAFALMGQAATMWWTFHREDRNAARNARAERLTEARRIAAEVSDAIAASHVAIMHLRAEARVSLRLNADLRPVLEDLGVAQKQLVATSFRMRALAPAAFIAPLDVFMETAQGLAALVPRVGDSRLPDLEWDAAVAQWEQGHHTFAKAIREIAYGAESNV